MIEPRPCADQLARTSRYNDVSTWLQCLICFHAWITRQSEPDTPYCVQSGTILPDFERPPTRCARIRAWITVLFGINLLQRWKTEAAVLPVLFALNWHPFLQEPKEWFCSGWGLFLQSQLFDSANNAADKLNSLNFNSFFFLKVVRSHFITLLFNAKTYWLHRKSPSRLPVARLI